MEIAQNFNIMVIKDISHALEIFEKAAFLHGQATLLGEYKIANKEYKNISKASLFLRKNDLVSTLEKFLSVDNISIRLWAASYLLDVNESKALATLSDIIDSDTSILGFNAKMIMEEWKKDRVSD